jgi:hypothetical protein
MPNVIQARAHLMQQIGDHIRNGYRCWASGTVPLGRAVAWAEKARTLYRTDEDRNRRARAKKRGLGSAYLFMYPLDRSIDNNRLGWVLLVTDGDHVAHKLEKLHRAEDDSLEIFGYALVREPRSERASPVWTWRFNPETYHAWRETIIDTVRRGSAFDVRQLLRRLQGAPGFSGIRAQIKALHRLIRYEWTAAHGKRSVPPALPRIWYCQRMTVVSVSLAAYLGALAQKRRQAVVEATESIETATPIEAAIEDAVQPVQQMRLELASSGRDPHSAREGRGYTSSDASRHTADRISHRA